MSDNTGTIAQVIGPVVDADFSKAGNLPKIYNALEIEYEVYGKPTKLVLEVQQHLGDGWVRAVAMSSSEGLTRGMDIKALSLIHISEPTRLGMKSYDVL